MQTRPIEDWGVVAPIDSRDGRAMVTPAALRKARREVGVSGFIGVGV
jgi:hypothetical protein